MTLDAGALTFLSSAGGVGAAAALGAGVGHFNYLELGELYDLSCTTWWG